VNQPIAGFLVGRLGGLGGLLHHFLARPLGGIPISLEPESPARVAESSPAGA
jgi:hypothetical protein